MVYLISDLYAYVQKQLNFFVAIHQYSHKKVKMFLYKCKEVSYGIYRTEVNVVITSGILYSKVNGLIANGLVVAHIPPGLFAVDVRMDCKN